MRVRSMLLSTVGALAVLATAAAQAGELARYNLSIPAEPLADALNDLAQQSGWQVLFSSHLVARVQGPQVKGLLTMEQALQTLLANTGLRFEFVNPHTITITIINKTDVRQVPDASKPSVDTDHQMKSIPDNNPDNQGVNAMPRRSFFARLGAFVGSIASTMFAVPAHAQATGADSHGLEEVIVTAERRETTAQRTALSLTVVGDKEIADRGLQSPQDLTSVVPGLRVANGGINLTFSLRGVGTSTGGPIGSDGIATYIDGIFLPRPPQSGLIYDLARIEVLAGPQGTLYGRGATGGAVNLIHNRPKPGFDASAELDLGNYNSVRSKAVINGSLTNWLSARLSGQALDHSGYYNNDTSNQHERAGNLQLLAQPTQQLSVLLEAMVDWSDNHMPGQVKAPYSGDPFDNSTLAGNSQQKQEREHYLLQADYDLGPATLTYLGAISRAPVEQIHWHNTGQDLSIHIHDDWNQQELRLSSNGMDRLRWTTGLFYMKTNLTYFQVNNANNSTAYNPNIDTLGKAAYGQATFSITDTFRVTAGLRYNRDEASLDGVLTSPSGSRIGPFASDTTFTATNWKGGLEWDVASQSMVYLTASNGYRPGGLNQQPPPSAGGSAANYKYDPEKVTHYELGSKNRFANGQIQLNGSVYYDDYKDYFLGEVVVLSPTNLGLRSFQITNAGNVTIKGAAVDAILALTPQDTLGLSANYLHAKFDRFVAAGINYAGDTVPQSPTTSANFDFEHTWNVGDGKLSARLDNSYSSSYRLAYQRVANVTQGSFLRSDVSLIYRTGNDNWTVAAYGKNLQDKRVINAAPFGPTGVWQAFDPPRTYGVRVGYRFH